METKTSWGKARSPQLGQESHVEFSVCLSGSILCQKYKEANLNTSPLEKSRQFYQEIESDLWIIILKNPQEFI